jgi:hypothetical protein
LYLEGTFSTRICSAQKGALNALPLFFILPGDAWKVSKEKISKGYCSVPLLFYAEKQKVPSSVLTFTSLLICFGDQGGSSTQHCLGPFFSSCTCSNLSGLSIPSAKQLNELILPLQPLLCQVLPSIMTTLVPFYKLIFKFLLNFQ